MVLVMKQQNYYIIRTKFQRIYTKEIEKMTLLYWTMLKKTEIIEKVYLFLDKMICYHKDVNSLQIYL